MHYDLFKYLHHLVFPTSSRWYPFLAVQYLTYQCDFRCPYCSNGWERPYYELHQEILPAAEMLQILRQVRKKCDYLVLTGGEPLNHPDFAEIIIGAGNMSFRDVALNTNGYELNRFLPAIAKAVTTLIVSLDTLDAEKADAWFGKTGSFRRIMANLQQAADYPGRKYRIFISAVATPANLPDLYEVYDFSQRHGFEFAVAPELQGVTPNPDLPGNKRYEEFIDFLLSEKSRGGRIHGTSLYLKHMRDFRKFSCRPFTMLVVDPSGGVFYPCLELGNVAGNLLAQGDLHVMRRYGEGQFGPQPQCGNQCHSACALGFSLILNHPLSILEELLSMGKGWLQVVARRGLGSRQSMAHGQGG